MLWRRSSSCDRCRFGGLPRLEDEAGDLCRSAADEDEATRPGEVRASDPKDGSGDTSNRPLGTSEPNEGHGEGSGPRCTSKARTADELDLRATSEAKGCGEGSGPRCALAADEVDLRGTCDRRGGVHSTARAAQPGAGPSARGSGASALAASGGLAGLAASAALAGSGGLPVPAGPAGAARAATAVLEGAARGASARSMSAAASRDVSRCREASAEDAAWVDSASSLAPRSSEPNRAAREPAAMLIAPISTNRARSAVIVTLGLPTGMVALPGGNPGPELCMGMAPCTATAPGKAPDAGRAPSGAAEGSTAIGSTGENAPAAGCGGPTQLPIGTTATQGPAPWAGETAPGGKT